MKQVLSHNEIKEPFFWLFDCFFRPTRLLSVIESFSAGKGALGARLRYMLWLVLPLFLCSYPIALILHLALRALFPQSTSACYLVAAVCVVSPNPLDLLLSTVSNVVLGTIIGVAIGSFGSIPLGITVGMALSIGLGSAQGLVGGMVLALVMGLVEGVALGTRDGLVNITAWTISLGLIFGVVDNPQLGLVSAIAFGLALGSARGIIGSSRDSTWMRSIAGILVGSIAGGGAWLLMAWLSGRGNVGSGWLSMGSISASYPIFLFMVCYLLGGYRLPVYPVSCISLYLAYFASRRQPWQVLQALHSSALYWDENQFLPFPYLKATLVIAARQDDIQVQVLQEIHFIVANRPRQVTAVRAAALELVLRDLEQRRSLAQIAATVDLFSERLPAQVRLLDPRWKTIFDRLSDVYSDARNYERALSDLARLSFLENMLANLEKIHPETRDPVLNRRLTEVVAVWIDAAQRKMDLSSRQIINPYNPGPILERGDSLFVGRGDLVHLLEQGLGRGNRRPTFFLYGERRMGKSSTLKQLPDLLGLRYLPITYDLQRPGMLASTASLLYSIAEKIYDMMLTRDQQVTKLEFEQLEEASKENIAAVYRCFDEWLAEIERILEQEDRILLLAFDEFEKLEEAWQNGYLTIKLLLDWFRHTIQHRPRLVLLFSGARTISEMKENWAGYFVNVQTLKVSFLKEDEARKLIMHPVPDFPSEIFGLGVVEEILRVTGGHPFHIQAVCEKLIDHLNDAYRVRARIEDVALAVEAMLESWWDSYFRDLWVGERTSSEQHACLLALYGLKIGDIQSLLQKSGLGEEVLKQTLNILVKRDLVVHTPEGYRIATPIFVEWVRRERDIL